MHVAWGGIQKDAGKLRIHNVHCALTFWCRYVMDWDDNKFLRGDQRSDLTILNPILCIFWYLWHIYFGVTRSNLSLLQGLVLNLSLYNCHFQICYIRGVYWHRDSMTYVWLSSIKWNRLCTAQKIEFKQF